MTSPVPPVYWKSKIEFASSTFSTGSGVSGASESGLRLSSAHASAKNKAAVKAAVLQDKEKIVFMGIKIKLLIKAISERTE